MEKLFTPLGDALKQGQSVVLATVLSSRGSVPAGAGAQMAFFPDGTSAGTVGGGALEHRVQTLARQAFSRQLSFLEQHRLNQGQAANLGMVCGGSATVLVQYIPATGKAAAFFALAGRVSGNIWLVWALAPDARWQMGLFADGLLTPALLASDGGPSALHDTDQTELEPLFVSTPAELPCDDITLYAIPLCGPHRAIVFGAGHVAGQLVPLLARVGFACHVFDDRPEFASPVLFPEAQQVLCGSFADIEATLPLEKDDFIVVVTRGHAADFEVERQVLLHSAWPFPYVGVIGSCTKTTAVAARLATVGVPQAAISAVHAPIGLAIGAKTPAEIAVSIAAQMIQVRAGLA